MKKKIKSLLEADWSGLSKKEEKKAKKQIRKLLKLACRQQKHLENEVETLKAHNGVLMEDRKKKPHRFTINEGECGGIVMAEDRKAGEILLKKRYAEAFPENLDIQVWPMEDDDYYKPEFKDVWECYGY